MSVLRKVERRKDAQAITITGKSVAGERVTLRLSFDEAAKLAAVLLAMLYGSLVEWWREPLDDGCPCCEYDRERHEGES